MHHYAVCVDNGFDAVIDSGVDGLARMSYVENTDTGLVLEIIEWNPLTRHYFNGLEEMVKEADGSQLVHEFKLSELTPKGAMPRRL